MPRAGVSGADGIGTKRTGKDAMAFALGYFSGDYAPITAGTVLTDTRDALWTRTSTLNSHTGLFNGNISWMNTELAGSQDQYDMQAMVYKYDQLHRIVQARSLRAYTSGTGFTTRATTNSLAYDAGYTYDGNGNLLTLQRRNAAAAIQDNFTYGYYANSNKLRQTASAQGDNYTYDQIGNLTADVAGGVTNIEWTPSGKVRKVTKSTGSPLEFRYDAAGNRVEKKQGTVITRYIRDASGNVMAVYQADTLSERPIYGSSRLGNLSYASKPGYRTVGHKQYELSNHLGNVLAVVSDRIRMKTDSTWTQVLSRTDYYPFGLEMTGRTESNTYRYGFNGKEKDPSGQWSNQSHYDYGFRIYNPTIGKFLSVDPLAKEFPWYTPYQFAGNMPIWAIDLDGLEPFKDAYKFAHEGNPKLNVLHSDNLVNMEFSKNPTSFNSLGWQRDKNYFWSQYVETPIGKDALSKSNLKLIASGYSPIVDEQWNEVMSKFSNDGELGEAIHHHHQNKGKNALAIPSSKHIGNGSNSFNHGMERRLGSVSQTFGKNISRSFSFLNVGSILIDSPNSPIYQYHQIGMGSENRAYPVNDIDSGIYYEWRWTGEEDNSNREVTFFSDYQRINGQWRGKDQIGTKRYFNEKGNEVKTY